MFNSRDLTLYDQKPFIQNPTMIYLTNSGTGNGVSLNLRKCKFNAPSKNDGMMASPNYLQQQTFFNWQSPDTDTQVISAKLDSEILIIFDMMYQNDYQIEYNSITNIY